jgi:hypothetical protein
MIAYWHKNGKDQPPVEVWDMENNTKGEFYEEYRMSRLREKRDFLLADTDWWASSDRTISLAETTYRQELRDLPATATPELDDNNEVIDVTWPTKPS